MPPTKQPMLPAPATPIGLSEIVPPCPRLGDSIADFCIRCLSARGRFPLAPLLRGEVKKIGLPCYRHSAPLSFPSGRHPAGENHGFTRRTQRDAAGPARP